MTLPGPDIPTASADEVRLVAALRAGDETAFASLLEKHHNSLVRLAMMYVPDRAVAEDVAQETWVGVLRGIKQFEGRSSLKTWIFRILTNTAKRRGQREARSIPFSSAWEADADDDEPSVDPARFHPPDPPSNAGHWAVFPNPWQEVPEDRALSTETRAKIQGAIDNLPPTQRKVITLRDVEGWSAQEICNILEISETNQRVLLHRARAKVRRALEEYFDES